MKGLKLAVCLMSCVALTFLYGLAAQASGFSPSLTTEEDVVPGSVVEVSFPYDGSLGEVAAFRVELEYDTAVLEYLRPQYSEIIQEGFVTTIPEPGLVASVYTSKGKGPYLTEGETIVYRFRVKEDAEPGAHSLFLRSPGQNLNLFLVMWTCLCRLQFPSRPAVTQGCFL